MLRGAESDGRSIKMPTRWNKARGTRNVEADLALVQHQEAVAAAQRLVHAVGHHQGGQAVLGDQLAGQIEDQLRRARVEGCRVLVE